MRTNYIAIVVICILAGTLTRAWDWHFRELRRLHEGQDTCRNLTFLEKIESIRYVKAQCYSYLIHFQYLPKKMQARCPEIQDGRCRFVDNEWYCSVLINPYKVAEPEDMELVPLTYCIEEFEDWDRLVEEGVPTEPEPLTTEPVGVGNVTTPAKTTPKPTKSKRRRRWRGRRN